MRIRILTVLVFVSIPAALRADEWTHFAATAERRSNSQAAAVRVDQPRWTLVPDADECFVDNASPVSAFGRVFINVRVLEDDVAVANEILALDAITGERLWHATLDSDVYDSWASPAIDLRNKSVLLASGQEMLAVDADTGAELWRTPFPRFFVNASAAISDDVGPLKNANRAFIMDYAPSGGAQLYAINVDPFDAVDNPYQPGEIAWQMPVGRAGGNIPAYHAGHVYCVTRDGRLYAFDAASGQQEYMIPATTQPFFGGVTIVGDAAYAGTYVFSGGQNNSLLVKFDLPSRQVVWTTPSERTNSIPVVESDRIYLAGGIQGYGSTPKLQAFRDDGASVVRLWDTYSDSAGKLSVGGWTLQPVWAAGRLVVGAPQNSGDFSPYVEINVLNLSFAPGETGFSAGSFSGAGASAAIARGMLYSHGTNGLVAFDLFAAGDLNCDGYVNNFDIDPFVLALTSPDSYSGLYPDCDIHFADVNGDGDVNNFDIDPFVAVLTGQH